MNFEKERYGLVKKIERGKKVILKKIHPCGSSEWKILRVGMDIRIKCCGCDRVVLIPRRKFERSIKEIVPD